MKTALLFLLVACGTTEPCPDAVRQIGPDYDVVWSAGVNSYGHDATCTSTISHPCPFLLYTTRFSTSDPNHFVWDEATGGVDEAGVEAQDRAPWVDEAYYLPNGNIELEGRGDDGGYRMDAILTTTGDGWTGTVAWNLFTVAGRTDFTLTLRSR